MLMIEAPSHGEKHGNCSAVREKIARGMAGLKVPEVPPKGHPTSLPLLATRKLLSDQ